MEQEKQLIQVQKFLRNTQTRVRLGAVEIVSGCSLDAQLHPFFTKLNIGKELINLISDKNTDIVYHSCVSLVNLSSNPNFGLNLLKLKPFERIIKELRSKNMTNPNKELLIKTMVNITQTNDGICALLQRDTAVQGLNVIRLIHILSEVNVNDRQHIRTCHYLPFLLCNITKNSKGRQLIMEPQRDLIRKIVRFMNYDCSTNCVDKDIGQCYKIFDSGIWKTIRNCIFVLNDEFELESANDTNNVFISNIIANNLIFEILNPIIAPLCEYTKEVRQNISKMEKEKRATLLKYMHFSKVRSDEEDIRKLSLECLHLIVGINDSILPKYLNEISVDGLLKEYEIWECSKALIKISNDIRSTIKHRLNDEIKEDNIQKDTDKEKEKGIEIQPMVQQVHSVQTIEKPRFNKEQASTLFDLVMQNSQDL